MNNIEILIEKWEKEFDYYKKKLDNDKSETIDQLYMAHFETRQIRAFIDDLKKLNLACVSNNEVSVCDCTEDYVCGLCFKEKGWCIKDGGFQKQTDC